jgi:hypothetical protein
MRMSANIWVQATPGYACVSLLSQRSGAPDPIRSASDDQWTKYEKGYPISD